MLSDLQKNEIQDAYRAYLERKSLTARYGQKHMLAQVARTLGGIELNEEGHRIGEPSIAVIEAGTGTGKTIGYALSAIPVAKALGKTLVISTATVALQEQVTTKDLPDILKNTELSFSYVLAKGRGRYLCTYKLEQLILFYSGTLVSLSLFEETMAADEAALSQFNEFMAQFGRGDWSGDRDQWPDKIDDSLWSSITSTHRECLNRRCPHYNSCPFFESRKALETADVVIANHDLVMADLTLGGGAILSAPEDTIYVFDEGHHLPDKALMHFANQMTVKYLLNQLDAWKKQLPKIRLELGYDGGIETLCDNFSDLLLVAHQNLSQSWSELQPWYNQLDAKNNTLTLLQPEQREPIFPILEPLQSPFSGLFDSVNAIDESVRKRLSNCTDVDEKERLQNALPTIGRWLSRLEPARDLLNAWLRDDDPAHAPTARWIHKYESSETSDLILNTSPVSAQGLLSHYLWNRACGAVVTSATLTLEGRFDRLLTQCGLPKQTDVLRVESPFNYNEHVRAVIPDYAVDGAKRELHTASIVQLITHELPKQAGNLVLFSSRAQMNEVYELMPTDWQDIVTLQDDLPKTALIQHHKDQLEKHGCSTLFGLASLAEGVDLPGNYLTNLVIAKIPFGVPDDPISATLSLWLEGRGMNPFQVVTLPAAVIRIVQACGRLIRHEADTGVIWLMDRRLIERRYGQTIFNSLPPYRWELPN